MPSVELIGVEAAGEGIATGRHAATLTAGKLGVLHGMKSIVLQDADGQVQETHSISAGLDYPTVGPEHAHLRDLKRATYVSVTDAQAIEGFQLLAAPRASWRRSRPATRSRTCRSSASASGQTKTWSCA